MSIFHKLLFLLCLLALPSCATFVAVLETISSSDVISLEEKMYLTDVLRSEAVKALPAEQNYTIMTRENINMMLPPGKAVEECEGSCLVETGKNIAADFVAQGRVGRFANNLTLTVELYETAGNKLVGSFSGKAPNIESLENEMRQKSQEMFSKIIALETAYKLKNAKSELDESQKAAEDAARDVAETGKSLRLQSLCRLHWWLLVLQVLALEYTRTPLLRMNAKNTIMQNLRTSATLMTSGTK